MEVPAADVPGTRDAKLARVIELVFKDEPEELEQVKLAYRSAAEVVSDEPEIDGDVIGLLEEMAMSDQVNTGDFKIWKSEARATFKRRLGARRVQARERTARAKAARQAKKGKGKGRGRGGGPRFWPGRKRGRAAGDADGGQPTSRQRPDGGAQPGGEDGTRPGSDARGSGPGGGTAPAGGASSGSAGAASKRLGVRPEASGSWEVFDVVGGWIRYNPQNPPQIDAHCSVHKSCKMDRRLARRVLGLHLAWLHAAESTPSMSKERHQELKWELSQ